MSEAAIPQAFLNCGLAAGAAVQLDQRTQTPDDSRELPGPWSFGQWEAHDGLRVRQLWSFDDFAC